MNTAQDETKLLLKAATFASLKHCMQRRRLGQAYIIHPLGVASILSDAGITDVEILCAAILHDTVEDTQTTFDELEREFGPQITQYVREATDNKALDKVTRKKLQVEHAKSISLGGKLVKYADKIDNMTSITTDVPCPLSCPCALTHSSPNIIAQGYCVWGKKVCEPFQGINAELDRRFAQILRGSVTDKDGNVAPAIPDGDLDAFLEEYYRLLAKSAGTLEPTPRPRSMPIKHITTLAELNETLKAPAVIVDFFATWCGPCKSIAPVFEQLAAENPSVVFVKIDVDQAEEICLAYKVRSMPTFVAFANGTEKERFSGADRARLAAMIAALPK